MRQLIISLSFLSIIGFSNSAYSSDLQPLMETMGKVFKASFKNAARGNNDEGARATVNELKLVIEKSLEVLPDGVSPNDTVVVERYRSLMGQLLDQAVLLEDSFATNPLDREKTIGILKEMDALRKKGHAIFR